MVVAVVVVVAWMNHGDCRTVISVRGLQKKRESDRILWLISDGLISNLPMIVLWSKNKRRKEKKRKERMKSERRKERKKASKQTSKKASKRAI